MRSASLRLLLCATLSTLLIVPAASGHEEAPQSAVPTPESVLGQSVGTDFFLATYDESLEYFRRLDAASDRLQLLEVGETSFGAPWYVALISSAENLRKPFTATTSSPGGIRRS